MVCVGNKSQAQVTEDSVCFGLDKQVPENWNLSQAFQTYPLFSFNVWQISHWWSKNAKLCYSMGAESRPTFVIVRYPLW